ncbi:hypothetical protein Tco_0662502 [Tanacetum coccineum]
MLVSKVLQENGYVVLDPTDTPYWTQPISTTVEAVEAVEANLDNLVQLKQTREIMSSQSRQLLKMLRPRYAVLDPADTPHKKAVFSFKDHIQEEDKEAICNIVASQTSGLGWAPLEDIVIQSTIAVEHRGGDYVTIDDVRKAIRGYTCESETMFYNYLRPFTSLDEGLYALDYEKDVCCLATLVRSFKLIEVYIEHGVIALDSYLRAPRFRVTIKEINDELGSIAANRTEKMLLLTRHESSETTKEPVCDSVTPSSLRQRNSSTPCQDYVCESITPRCMPDCMLTPPTNESVITYT